MDYQELKRLMSEQKEEMTPSERMAAYMKGEEVDCIPYGILAPEMAIADLMGYSTKQMSEDPEVMAKVIREKDVTYNNFGFGVGPDLRTIGVALGSKLFTPEYGVPRIEEHVLMDYADFDKLKIVDPYDNPVLTPMIEMAKQLKKLLPDYPISTGVTGPVSCAAAIRPVDLMLRDTRKNPEMLKKLLKLSNECLLKWVEAFCKEFGPCSVFISDPVTCSDILSKKQFDEFSYPYLKELIDGLYEITGQPPMIHICGKTKPIWNDIANSGVCAFSIDNCEDLAEAKEAIGDKVMLMGNVPPVDVMLNGTIDEVIASCKECIEKAGDSPKGFQLNVGCQTPFGTSKENMEALIYAARKYGRGAKIGCLPKGLQED
ncbi:MAG: uroporphyrinogen decarboxylase family protein [Lachnospiraceae bacterium]